MAKRRSRPEILNLKGGSAGRLRGEKGIDVEVARDGDFVLFRMSFEQGEEIGEALPDFDRHRSGEVLHGVNSDRGVEVQQRLRFALVGVGVGEDGLDVREPEVERVVFFVHLEEDHALVQQHDRIGHRGIHHELEVFARTRRVALGERRKPRIDVHGNICLPW